MMSLDPSPLKKIRRLSQALMISGALNIGVLGFLAYWVMRERPPTPYCELKPIEGSRQISLTDEKGIAEVITHLFKLPYWELISRLEHHSVIENGYAERDLALACLVTFHDFDLLRALPRQAQPQQKREFVWKLHPSEPPLILTVYPNLTQQQYDQIIHFAKTEQWPMTSKGLFKLLKTQKKDSLMDTSLAEAFFLTPEFWTVEILFNRLETSLSKQNILDILVESDWEEFKKFVEQQRQKHDLSDARRHKFLLDYIQLGSSSAASFLVKTDFDFAIKKLTDAQVILLLQLLKNKTETNVRFAKEMLRSPRSANVWKYAAAALYAYEGEAPISWNYEIALARFLPDQLPLQKKEPQTKSQDISVVSKLVETVSPLKALTKENVSEKKNKKTVASTPKTTLKNATKPSNSLITTMVTKDAPKKGTLLFSSSQPSPYLKQRLYTVQDGDSLWKIAKQFSVEVDVLRTHNQLSSDAIRPGTVLKIP